MLIILFGVSCVGKSTLIRDLKNNSNWLSIPTYMTRPLRSGEIEKISISDIEFSQMERDGCFISVNEIFGNKYGTPKKEIKLAISSPNQHWILDFPLSKKDVLDKYHHIGFIVMPESETQLVEQIRISNRTDRQDAILDEYRNVYLKYQQESVEDSSVVATIVNIAGKSLEVSQRIKSIVASYNHEYSE